MIDTNGYRLNVGIVLCNLNGDLLWAKRCGQDAWQFPQGGIRAQETLKEALYRELWEEIGLLPEQVHILAESQTWISYDLPKHLIRSDSKPVCIGQKQRWFLLSFLGDDPQIRLDSFEQPEFDDWRWVDFWHPLNEVVPFKHHVYKTILKEFEPIALAHNINSQKA
ncbi:MAG: RNA pyrophosphohydrolase [Gammaproteobacteria bacterium]|nr:RNA pyrophosphohydrolase [Gammaproteobacteria bacterium]